jgi:hypothetical protein
MFAPNKVKKNLHPKLRESPFALQGIQSEIV